MYCTFSIWTRKIITEYIFKGPFNVCKSGFVRFRIDESSATLFRSDITKNKHWRLFECMPIRTHERTVIGVMFFFFFLECLKYLELAKSYPKTPTTESISNQSVSYVSTFCKLRFFLTCQTGKDLPGNWNSTRADQLTFAIDTLTVISFDWQLRSYVGEWIQNRTRQIFNYTVSDDVVAAAADPKKFPYMVIV